MSRARVKPSSRGSQEGNTSPADIDLTSQAPSARSSRRAVSSGRHRAGLFGQVRAEAGPGVIETQIYNIVQNANSPNIFAILRDAVKLVNPRTSVQEIISITEAIVNGGMFLAAGPNAAHYTYDTTLGMSIPPFPGVGQALEGGGYNGSSSPIIHAA